MMADLGTMYALADAAGLPASYALVAVRLLGLMIAAPLLGSSQIPRMVKLYLGLSMALCLCASGGVAMPARLPDSPWVLAAGMAGELALGLTAGLLLSTAFTAAHWAGGVAGQQMGFNMAGAIQPGADIGGNPIGDALFTLTLLAFLAADGHHDMILGVGRSFEHLPPLAFMSGDDALALLVASLKAAGELALRIAAPVCTAMLVVDLALGMLGKTIPALNLLSVGLSLRALIGLGVVAAGLGVTGGLLAASLGQGLDLAMRLWTQT